MLFTLKKFRRQLNKRLYHPLNRIELSKDNLINNYQYLSTLKPHIQIAPVLKSNAYGHGLIEIASILDKLNPPFFCADSLFEAYELKNANIKSPILITGYIDPRNLRIKHLPFSYAVFDLEFAKTLNTYQPGTKIHLFVDTGMGREGITLEELPEFIRLIKEMSGIKVEGLMSHFASADETDFPQTNLQIANFDKALEIVKNAGINPKWVHISASAGFLATPNLNCNLARVGKALYGLNPFTPEDHNLKPVLRLLTKIAEIKRLKKGSQIGYNHTHELHQDSLIAILPLGYFDGVDRRLSNQGVIRIENTICPIIGRVSMNITTVDISAVADPFVGQEVEVISPTSTQPNSIVNIAKACHTIPHEIMVHLTSTTRRDIV